MPALTGAHHVALTVTDVDRSVPWYERVLGFTTEGREDDEGDQGLRKVFLHGFGMTLTLVQHPGAERAAFDECRPGLDHLTLPLADPAALATWARRLTDLGVSFTAPDDSPTLSLRDPDGIQLVLAAG
ncbi:glyoxalase/bleomycin resistance protein/dioxygenase [Actinokineospora spheciospongiae]|uniref:Glyoxalase/bleomycin resistance protein/dioxygenase n=1 Tax=Actinokineospora spheciospongiae TaxID=909613 RepID=W7J614_9PSEU|nr:VOC family protein [Actinokineospora spheciospongiae]EWC61529.1 glyoxalase/bleomycin resistance protein/dioxygenase [Actinokineospora spheciospongiae]PWW61797.1 glyoxylase I family protein [Actinokineospora spheciospongiae]